MNSESHNDDKRKEREKLFDLMKDFDTTVLITRTTGGELRGRPMAIAEIGKEDGIWFSTAVDNPMIDDIGHDPQVCLSMQSKSHFVSLSGRATVHDDRAKVHQLWKPTWKIWFPDGKDDPKIRLLQIIPAAGDYWDLAGKNRWRVLWEMGEAYCMHRQPIFSDQAHAHVELHENA
ncbi:MAG: pyridoxamine 5'-phosphate oxidase family protein [Aureliella sp.]